MHNPVLPGRSWMIVFLCLSVLTTHTVSGKSIKNEGLRTIESICPSRTINYITATLPQQCLRTDWSSGQTSTGVNAENSASPSFTRITYDTLSQIPKQSDISAAGSEATASASVRATQSGEDGQDIEQDPLSENANFLSFEDWKGQMLQKTGQSPEHVLGTKINQRKKARAGGINNALDGYGEDGEIEIEFGGFPVPEVSAEAIPVVSDAAMESKAADPVDKSEKPQRKSREAGTTSKHRFNYASFDCAATILKTNTGSKGSTSILSENKDSYMINACSLQNKFIVVELCDDINIDTIVLANFEFFSSTFRSFRVSVADRYPVKAEKWESIGTFEARNNRGVQPFLIENMRTWGRYLRIELLTHYGAEYYCPVSLLRVHGKTMMDDWKADVKASQGEDDDDDEAEDIGSEKVTAQPVKETSEPAATKPVSHNSTSTALASLSSATDYSFYDYKCPRVSLHGPLVEQNELLNSHCHLNRNFCHMAKIPRVAYTSVVYPDVRTSIKAIKPIKASSGDDSTRIKSKTKPETVPSVSHATPASIDSVALDKTPVISSKFIQRTKSSNVASISKVSPTHSGSAVSASSSGEPRSTSSSKSATYTVASSAPQDSFFKSVHKRLQQLEANSTLSLQYIEEQSRILREAFTKVEKRQLSKTTNFLETLNATVLTELRQFRLQYDQIWQSTVLELSAQREQSQREVTALSQRLSLLADEILWQRRLAIFQFGLIMLCLALVMFSRNAAGASTFDMSSLQSMVGKQKTSRYLNLESPLGSPSRPSSRYVRLARSFTSFRSPSNADISDDGIADKAIDGEGHYQLPTPGSEIDEPQLIQSLDSSPEPDLSLRRAQSEPNLITESDDFLDADEQEQSDNIGTVCNHDSEPTEEAMKLLNTR